MRLNAMFGQAADKVSKATGHPVTFVLGCLVIVIRSVSGPMLHFLDAAADLQHRHP
ncbi:low affinity iron permease family protein [Labrys okinawensis]|uniref:low affinity iron permease family protein n=1 Tax=Labrys okinawensis TaxID=346911 RepID=UPI0039BC8321